MSQDLSRDRTEQQSFLDAICANPADLGVRLIYADWLEENADKTPDPEESRVRAEFIRGQIRESEYRREMEESEGCKCTMFSRPAFSGSRVLYCPRNCRYCTLTYQCAQWKLREKHILSIRGDRWAFRWQTRWMHGIDWGTTLGADSPELPITTLHNGFCEKICLPLAAFVSRGDEIVRRQPIMRMVIKDKHPNHVGIGHWTWQVSGYVGPIFSRPHILPRELFDALDPQPDKDSRYRSSTDALAALHRGAANLARRWAKIETCV